MVVTIDVSDRDALVDDVINIVVRGLTNRQAVTIHAITVENAIRFGACGCFYADDHGTVDLAKQASLAGTYMGVSPMGLFWSMKSAPGERKGMRIIKSDATTPFHVKLKVIEGHFSFEELYTAGPREHASTGFRRWYMAKGVRKIKVRSGRLRGNLFLPPGPGPHLGVIDMFGTIGSIVEFRAALLASRGFAALALPYFGYDDLPKWVNDMELEYFLEAVKWLSDRPEVVTDRIGMLGVSKGGEIALHSAYHSTQVKAVVSINGLPYVTGSQIWYQGKLVGNSDGFILDNVIPTSEGNIYKHAMVAKEEYFFPLWNKDVKIMFVVGEDDQMVNSEVFTKYLGCFPADKKRYCRLLKYPGAGHLIEPPYSPLCRSTYGSLKGYRHVTGLKTCLWGGVVEDHAFAQEDSWKKILEHFKTHLPPDNTMKIDSKL